MISFHCSEPTSCPLGAHFNSYAVPRVMDIPQSFHFCSSYYENRRDFGHFSKYKNCNVKSVFSNDSPPRAAHKSWCSQAVLPLPRLSWESLLAYHLKTLITCFTTDPVRSLFVLVACAWCQFSDEERELPLGSIYNMSLRTEC